MGGSAIGGDLVRGIFADRLSVPLEVVRGYDLPAWVGPHTLVVAVSYSGATEETISALEAALRRALPGRRRHHRRAAARGGPAGRAAAPRLPRRRAAAGGGRLPVAPAGRPPRARRPPGPRRRRDRGGRRGGRRRRLARDRAAECPPRQPGQAAGLGAARPPAARRGGSGFMAAVARRWKTQLNENGKSDRRLRGAARGDPQHGRGLSTTRPTCRTSCAWCSWPAALDHPRDRLRAHAARRACWTACT